MFWSSVDAARSHSYRHVPRYHMLVSGWSSTLVLHMLHAVVVSMGSSTIWTHIFHHAWVVCGCSSITFVQTYSQISTGCLWTELNLSVAYVTFIRPLRRELDNMNTYLFIMLWSSVDAVRLYFCKHSLRYHVVISGWSSTSLFHMLHAFVVSVGSSTLWTHIFHHAWVVCGCSSITFVKTYSQISAGCLWTELNRNVAHVTFIRRLRREFDNMNTSIFLYGLVVCGCSSILFCIGIFSYTILLLWHWRLCDWSLRRYVVCAVSCQYLSARRAW